MTALDRRLEEAALNAWPARHTMLLDGWVLRFASGYTKRANSATPLYPSEQPFTATLAAVEALYAAQQLPPIVRLLEFTNPAELDALLAARGYHTLDPSLVLYRDLTTAVPTAEPRMGVTTDLSEWLADYIRLSGAAAQTLPSHRAILERTVGRVLLRLKEHGNTVAVGLGVQEGDCFGLFDIVVEPAARRRGYGAALVSGMLALALEQGARHAYLQVVAANQAARRLYHRLGFSERYRYWYRVRTAP